MNEKPRMLFLFSDTGGGHRSAAEAVIEAVEAIAGESVEIQLVDFLKEHAPIPFNRLPELYPFMVKKPAGWGLGYRLSDNPGRARALTNILWPYISRAARRIIGEWPVNLIVSFHPLANVVVARELARRQDGSRARFVVVVTDLVSTHAFWYLGARDLTIVPTEPAERLALKSGLPAENVRVIGLPVAAKFCKPAEDKAVLRRALGWDADRRIVLIVGGGDGMGPLEQTARAVAASGLNVGIAIVTGRNKDLYERLSGGEWPVPVYAYGFVRNMADLMQAADVLVTKAGPGTISEGLNAGLPEILYSYLPGQEAGNVPYLTDQGAGIWAPEPADVVAGLRTWLENDDAYERASEAARRLARPDAAEEVAHLLLQQIKG